MRWAFGGAGWSPKPELTDEKYCVWDEPHDDYLYTDAWVRKLVKDLANPFTFKAVTGSGPKKLPASASRERGHGMASADTDS